MDVLVGFVFGEANEEEVAVVVDEICILLVVAFNTLTSVSSCRSSTSECWLRSGVQTRFCKHVQLSIWMMVLL
jgi:hypothetical protein